MEAEAVSASAGEEENGDWAVGSGLPCLKSEVCSKW